MKATGGWVKNSSVTENHYMRPMHSSITRLGFENVVLGEPSGRDVLSIFTAFIGTIPSVHIYSNVNKSSSIQSRESTPRFFT